MRMKLRAVLADERAGVDAHDGRRARGRALGGTRRRTSRGSGSVRNYEVFDINEGFPSWENHKRRGLPGRVMSLPLFVDPQPCETADEWYDASVARQSLRLATADWQPI